MWAALREKVPCALSRCHTKGMMGMRGCADPSFGMTPTIQKKKKKKELFKKKFQQKKT